MAIDRVPSGDSIDVSDKRITLDYTVLDQLNEAEHGN